MNSLLNIAINVSIVQQNQSCKTYMKTVVTSLGMNLHLNITIIVIIVQQNLPFIMLSNLENLKTGDIHKFSFNTLK